jgi:hypothetical protein
MSKSPLRTTIALAAAGALVAVALPTTALAGSTETLISTKLSGKKEIGSPGDPDGTGQFTAITTKNTLCYTFSAKRIGKAAAAHIHTGGKDVTGPVSITLMLPTPDGVAECLEAVPDAEDTSTTLGESELAGLKANPKGYYVQAHTPDFPAGAIRGQLH